VVPERTIGGLHQRVRLAQLPVFVLDQQPELAQHLERLRGLARGDRGQQRLRDPLGVGAEVGARRQLADRRHVPVRVVGLVRAVQRYTVRKAAERAEAAVGALALAGGLGLGVADQLAEVGLLAPAQPAGLGEALGSSRRSGCVSPSITSFR
jgi:hypothetical protein